MNAPLFRLVYISRNEISGDEATVRREIDQILASARVKNPIENITGALMFNAGCFAQVLEGSHDEIQNTFERIQCDPRHSHVVILAFEPASERSFSNWSMAYLGTNSNASAKFGDITNKSGFDPALLEGDHIFDLLKEHLIEAESTSH
ncbi:BLUF domain-containing protein [Methylicorpusculum oleiharenae]|uniref:BLUF domain-containing protein n=1 Tax=Methylicorpusculum oleiharenae TaxID=1338687 RepID=UPI00135C864D|nr:BLUF domain-containing protein [Methylicorpusculum oleiharenae]MCD2451366.1 BLUF domain-containing protein [Methylicorpusculum oleiharenae]